MTVMMWRKGAMSPKVRALREVLVAHAGTSKVKGRRTNGK
jgi:DNA-binding transcriptional LysR family regulator